jgi:hypothetical protein
MSGNLSDAKTIDIVPPDQDCTYIWTVLDREAEKVSDSLSLKPNRVWRF